MLKSLKGCTLQSLKGWWLPCHGLLWGLLSQGYRWLGSYAHVGVEREVYHHVLFFLEKSYLSCPKKCWTLELCEC